MGSLTTMDMIIRLAAAMAVGFVVGGQRARTYHSAGLRTHMLVCIGACVVMLIGLELFQQTYLSYGTSPDPARLGAQVVSGIGFLGAGTIIKEGFSVRGLTTAASVWTVACLGLAAGMGYFFLLFCGTAALFTTLSVVDQILHRWNLGQKAEVNIHIECDEMATILLRLEELSQQCNTMVHDMSFNRTDHGTHALAFRAVFPGKDPQDARSSFLQQIAALPGIIHLENA